MKKFATVLAMAMWVTISFSQKVGKKLIDAKATNRDGTGYEG